MSLDVTLSRLFKLFPEGRFPGSGINGTKGMHISHSPKASLKAEAASGVRVHSAGVSWVRPTVESSINVLDRRLRKESWLVKLGLVSLLL